MNVLIIGKDSTIFENSTDVLGDTRKRHLLYSRLLREKCGDKSEIKMISYSPRKKNYDVLQLDEGITIYPSSSFLRETFLLDLVRLSPKILKGWKPDLITVQTPWEEGIFACLISKIIGCKSLLQLHFDIFSTEWLREKITNRIYLAISKFVFSRADRTRVVSNKLQEKMVEHLNLKREVLPIIPVGVNFNPLDSLQKKNIYKEKIDSKLKDCPVVLFVGRLCDQKNLQDWVRVAKNIKQKVKHTKFLIAGDGEARKSIEDLVQEQGLSEEIIFLGKVGYEKLPEIYAAADVFLLTSHYEGYGRVVLEAYLSRIPVVSTACTGPEDLILPDISGILTGKGDINALSSAVIKMLKEPELAREMAQHGYDFVSNNFSSVKLAEKLVDCWAESCLSDKIH